MPEQTLSMFGVHGQIAAHLTRGTSEVVFKGATGFNAIVSGGSAFYNLTIDTKAVIGESAYYFADDMVVNGKFYLKDGWFGGSGVEGVDIIVMGDWEEEPDGVFFCNNGTVTLAGSTTNNITINADSTFGNVYIGTDEGSGGTWTLTLGSDLTANLLQIKHGTFNAGDNTLTIGTLSEGAVGGYL